MIHSSALKYLRSNQQGIYNEKSQKKRKTPFQVGFFMLRFFVFWGVGFFGANSEILKDDRKPVL